MRVEEEGGKEGRKAGDGEGRYMKLTKAQAHTHFLLARLIFLLKIFSSAAWLG